MISDLHEEQSGAGDLSFLDGGGDIGARMRGFDWTAHPLGPPQGWPQPLKTAVGLILATGHPMCLTWGPDLTFFYNNSYAPILMARHPDAIGQPIAQVWADIWSDISPLIDRTLAGEAIWQEDMHLVMARSGRDEDTWWTFSYSPLRDTDGTVRGFVNICNDTTSKVLTERRLIGEREVMRESERRFHAMADSIDQMVWSTRPDGHHDYYNQRWYDFTGTPEGSTDGEGWSDMFHPEDQQQAWAVWRRSLETGEPYHIEYRLRHRSGEYRWVIGRALPVRDDSGAIARWYGTCTDVHELKQIQQALVESEARYRALFDAIDEGFCIIEFIDGPEGPLSDYVHVDANPAYLANAGIAEIAGKRLREIVSASEADAWAAIYGKVLTDGAPIRFERELVETGRHLELAAFRIEPAERRQVAVLFQDITARKKAEAALQELNATLEERVAERTKERDRLWTLSADMLARADFSGMMSAVNPAWSKVLGWSEQKLLTTGYADFMHPDDAGTTLAAIAAMERTGQPTRFQNRIRTAGGEWTPIDWTVAPEPDGVNFIAVGRDLTEDKAREEELELAREALRQAQKMETLGQLTGGVAHDFNNLLQIVSGNIGLIQRALPETDAKLRRAADNAARGAERAAVLTQRLLAFSRRQPLAPKAIEPNKLVAGMSDLLHRTLGETIEIETVLSPRLWSIEADPHQLENAILNLAINARDAMPDGGKLTIETCNTHLDRAYVLQNAEVATGQYVCICVTDCGGGMDADTVTRAFEPFFTTKEVGKGTGLGLSMVYGFVKQSGGHLKIYSEPGEGTTVKVYLPRLVGDVPAEEEGADELVPEGGQHETILVCEDDEDVRAYSVEVLRELGYRVLQAEDGPSALALLERAGSVDLLFTDVVLPSGMTGAVLAREAQSRLPGLKVLFTTGYARNAIVHHGRLDAGVELITKPFSYADLAARVRDLLDGQK